MAPDADARGEGAGDGADANLGNVLSGDHDAARAGGAVSAVTTVSVAPLEARVEEPCGMSWAVWSGCP